MKIKGLMVVVALVSSVVAVAVPPNIGAPITTGAGANASSTEVRITANVVEGIAVNEASPIDFGNLVRGMYDGKVSQNVPGRITLKGTPSDTIKLKLNKDKTDLTWLGPNGTKEANPDNSTKVDIKDVKIYGLTTSETSVTLDATGDASKILTADFTAGKGDDANLGVKQRLGAYVGTIIVTASK